MKEKPEINPVTWLEKKVLEQDIEIERLREALKDLLNATDQWVFQESYPLAVEKAKAALREDE